MTTACFCERVLKDLWDLFKNEHNITEFEIIPKSPQESQNKSPVLVGGNSLGLESWAISHVLPHAYKKVIEANLRRDGDELMPYLLSLHLLVPDMSTAWNRRKELIEMRKIPVQDEMRLTKMTLLRKPKSNDVLSHRRWLFSKNYVSGDTWNLLRDEMALMDMLADRHHSNYHAWTHRQWILQHLVPATVKKSASKIKYPLKNLSKCDMLLLFRSTHFCFYLVQLNTNLEFVAGHVSDHSALHHRKFLLSQAFLILENFDTNSYDDNTINSGNEKEALKFFGRVERYIYNFLNDVSTNSHNISEYLEGLKLQISYFDIMIGMIIHNLHTNLSLSSFFEDHEALWYFRRFLIHKFESLLKDIKRYCNNNYETNKKESVKSTPAKLCRCKNCEIVSKFASQLVENEEKIIVSKLPHLAVANYSRWFQRSCRLKSLT